MVAHDLSTYDIGKIGSELGQLLNQTCENKRFLKSGERSSARIYFGTTNHFT